MDLGTPILVIIISPKMSRKRTVRANTVSNFIIRFICGNIAEINLHMKKNLGKILLFASVFAFLDQVSKYLVQKYELEYTQNTGVAFGIKIPFIAILTLILIPVIIYIALKELDLNNKITKISIGLILAGALGNLIDRLSRGFFFSFF